MGKTRDHIKRHAKKYTLASAGVTLVTVLQLFGALSPVICNMPWVKDPVACLEQGKRADEAADRLGKLDGMKLDTNSTEDGGTP